MAVAGDRDAVACKGWASCQQCGAQAERTQGESSEGGQRAHGEAAIALKLIQQTCYGWLAGLAQKVGQQRMTLLGEHAFGVELHPLNVGEIAVAQAHDRAVVEPGGDLEAVGQRLALGDQAVVSGGGERVGQTLKHALAAVVHRRGFAVHQLLCPHHLAAIYLGDRLVAQAHAQGGDGGAELLQHLQTHSRLIWIAGAW